jgi:hypothetical protein
MRFRLPLVFISRIWRRCGVFLEHVVVFFFYTFVLFSLRVERLRFQSRFPRPWCVALMSTDFGLLILSYQECLLLVYLSHLMLLFKSSLLFWRRSHVFHHPLVFVALSSYVPYS